MQETEKGGGDEEDGGHIIRIKATPFYRSDKCLVLNGDKCDRRTFKALVIEQGVAQGSWVLVFRVRVVIEKRRDRASNSSTIDIIVQSKTDK